MSCVSCVKMLFPLTLAISKYIQQQHANHFKLLFSFFRFFGLAIFETIKLVRSAIIKLHHICMYSWRKDHLRTSFFIYIIRWKFFALIWFKSLILLVSRAIIFLKNPVVRIHNKKSCLVFFFFSGWLCRGRRKRKLKNITEF